MYNTTVKKKKLIIYICNICATNRCVYDYNNELKLYDTKYQFTISSGITDCFWQWNVDEVNDTSHIKFTNGGTHSYVKNKVDYITTKTELKYVYHL